MTRKSIISSNGGKVVAYMIRNSDFLLTTFSRLTWPLPRRGHVFVCSLMLSPFTSASPGLPAPHGVVLMCRQATVVRT